MEKIYGKLPEFMWENVDKSGAYLIRDWGALVRFESEDFSPGHSPRIKILHRTGCTLVRLSEDPYITLRDAREIASDNDYFVNF